MWIDVFGLRERRRQGSVPSSFRNPAYFYLVPPLPSSPSKYSEGRGRWMSQLKQREQIHPFSVFFVLFRLSTDWMMATHIGEGNLLY